MTDSGATLDRLQDEISDEILAVQEDSYACGVHRIVTRVFDDVVLVVLDVKVTQAEQTLLDAGRGEAVKESREAYQSVIAPTFTAVVERATGRRVRSFMSHMNIDPLYSVELFRLAPEEAPMTER